MTKPTILFVHYNADSTGSALKRIEHLIKEASGGYKVCLLLPKPGIVSKHLSPLGVEIVFRSFNENTGIISYLINALSFAIFCKRRKVALIHLLDHVWWKPAELFAAKLMRLPFISMITFNRPKDAKAGAVRWARQIVANSNSTAKDFIDEGLGDKTSVIYNAISLSDYSNLKSIREELFREAEFLFGYVGILHPIKGIDVLIEAFSKLIQTHPNTRLAIVGSEKEEGYTEALKALCQSLGVSSFVNFCGFREDIPEVMASLDTLVVPSRQEPFGYVTIEAGAAKTPLIASAVGGIPEIVRDAIDGLLVKCEDVDSLTMAMDKMYTEPLSRQKLSTEFRARVEQHFSNEQMLRQWKTLWQSIIA